MPYDPKLGPGNPYLFDDAKGLQYQVGSDGKRSYTPKFVSMQGQGLDPSDPRLRSPTDPGSPDYAGSSGFLHGTPEFQSGTGEYKAPIQWGNLMGLAIGGAIAGPALTGALAGPGGVVPEMSVTTSALPAGLPSGSVVGAANAAGGSGMGLGSILSKGLGFLGKGSDALSAIGSVGQVLGGAATGSADRRNEDARNLLLQQQLNQTQSRDTHDAGLKDAEFQRTEQDRQRKAAILSALLGSTHDASIMPGNPNIAARMPTMTGGARPSNLTGGGNAAALMSLLGQVGPTATPYQAPAPLALPQAGKGEGILGGIGLGSSILGAIGRKPQVIPQQGGR